MSQHGIRGSRRAVQERRKFEQNNSVTRHNAGKIGISSSGSCHELAKHNELALRLYSRGASLSGTILATRRYSATHRRDVRGDSGVGDGCRMHTSLRGRGAMQANKTGDHESCDQDEMTHRKHSFMQGTIYIYVKIG